MLTTVKSALPEFSIRPPVSAESDEISFSPTWKVPRTFVRTRSAPDVSSPNTKPLAPLIEPTILLPPFEATEIKVGLGVPDILIIVKGLISKRNIL